MNFKFNWRRFLAICIIHTFGILASAGIAWMYIQSDDQTRLMMQVTISIFLGGAVLFWAISVLNE
jgi:predicted membrane channel-forming protein YqfA (hemolysin III family)